MSKIALEQAESLQIQIRENSKLIKNIITGIAHHFEEYNKVVRSQYRPFLDNRIPTKTQSSMDEKEEDSKSIL
jgi:hypothetical protein